MSVDTADHPGASDIRIFMMRFTKPLSCPPEGESAFTCERAARTKGRGNAGEQQLCTSHPSPHTESTVACERSARMRAEMAGVHGWDKACKSAMMRPASGEAENAQRERVGIAELPPSCDCVLSLLCVASSRQRQRRHSVVRERANDVLKPRTWGITRSRVLTRVPWIFSTLDFSTGFCTC